MYSYDIGVSITFKLDIQLTEVNFIEPNQRIGPHHLHSPSERPVHRPTKNVLTQTRGKGNVRQLGQQEVVCQPDVPIFFNP